MRFYEQGKPLWVPLVIVLIVTVAVFAAGYHNAAWWIGNFGTVLALVFSYGYIARRRRQL